VERRGACKVLVWKPEGKDHLENLGIEGSVISKWIFKKWDAVAWTGLIWLSIERGVNGVMIFRVP
jgi:uncharacterized membrane protein YeaQ/YmgE (transglycosylase-associated protein family)